MKVILLDKIKHLGNLGDEIVVKPGYARNYLIPNSKAVLATKANSAIFAEKKADFEAAANARLQEAQARAQALSNVRLQLHAKVAEEGKLYGSIGPAEIVAAVKQQGLQLKKQEVVLPEGPIKAIGDYDVQLSLHHGEVETTIAISIHPEE